ncbi:MAG: hypothetical protein ACJ761_05180, partial [Chloroflexota bacterium]
AAVAAIEPEPEGGFLVRLRRTDGGGDLAVEADEVIAATGFTTPLQDLGDIGVDTVGSSRLPVQTAWWESRSRPGLFFAGTIGQGARGLQKRGIPSNSGAVHGARYNATVLARRIAAERFGRPWQRPELDPAGLVDFLATELAEAPELWHQRGYLARFVSADPGAGLRDEGIQPLAHVLDTPGPAGLAVTLEADGSGAIFPVVYVCVDGGWSEHALEPDPLLRYDTPSTRHEIEALVRPLIAR